MSDLFSLLKENLEVDEGRRLKLYKCTAGFLTIGVGRNIETNGISDDEADLMLKNDINRAITDTKKLISNFDKLSVNRQYVLVNMMFNLGMNRFSQFRRFIAAVKDENYPLAAAEMENSRWFYQVKSRAVRLVNIWKKG